MENKILQENIRLKKEMLKKEIDYDVQMSHLKRLIDLSSILNTSLDLKEVLTLCFRYISNVFYFDKAIFIFEHDKISYEYEVENVLGEIRLSDLNREKYDVFSDYFKEIKKDKNNILCKNTDGLENFKEMGIESFLASVLVHNGVFIGKTFLLSDEKDVYTDRELKVISILIDHVMPYIEKAILFQKVKDLSMKDYLTGIYNRRYFFDFLEKEFMRTKRSKNTFSLILCDVDYFKNINDKNGHLVGDKVLVELSSILKKVLRVTDVLARYGGEEFIIALPETKKEEALKIALRIRELVSNNKIMDLDVTLSFGVTVYSGENNKKSVDELVEEADQALYLAKDNGRDRVEFFRGEGN